ncbi:DNAJ heat shock N-terminal domain-containing protein [Zostera marina]|uniref:DNAJ heat shock N-terminal domain-containing protein n=1 Tax=Zostera marina TaxID=29655 RepID=A0A0K9P2A4_ZOSMR|nr:DNAJ heat shock N-terminal domain-containing protein [Zostera marina]
MSSASSFSNSDHKKRWWVTNRKMCERHVVEARSLIATQQALEVSSAIAHLDAAIGLFPRHEIALELKARSLLFLRKFKQVADMLRDYIPSFKSVVSDDDDSYTSINSGNSREKVQLLSSDTEHLSFWCFSVSELRKKVLAGLKKRSRREGHWRYIVLGHACCHLGMLEDAMVLLQTGRRLAASSFRRESKDLHDDEFSDHLHSSFNIPSATLNLTELETTANLLSHIKLLIRRRTAAVAALEADLPSESIRHFSKILDSRRGIPSTFAALCFIGRAAANKSAGRIADSISDCNRALSLDPTSIPAMRARADLLESIRSFPDSLRDLDHLKLLYDAILRDGNLPGPVWRPHHGIRFRDIPRELRILTERTQEVRQRVGIGERIDYYGVLGVSRTCSRSELDTTHLLLTLKHRPDKASVFVDRLEFVDEHRGVDIVKDEARMSALILYRMLQKGYSSIMLDVADREAVERQRVFAAVAEEEMKKKKTAEEEEEMKRKKAAVVEENTKKKNKKKSVVTSSPVSAFQGVFCRDLAIVGGLLSQVGFNQHQPTIPVKMEGLIC